MRAPTQSKFVYNRRNAPFFYHTPGEDEVEKWERRKVSVSREFFRKSKQSDYGHARILSNGMSAGEFAMYLIWTHHDRRH
jgi:hypothetical protein